MKIALANPGVGPFVQQTARALLEGGVLAGYWTSFVDQPDGRWRRGLTWLGRAGGLNLDRELRRRVVTEIPAELVRTYPLWEIVRSSLSKIKADSRLVDAVWDYGTRKFDQNIAQRALKDADGIYGYEYSALASFLEAKRRGLARIYEVSSPEHDFVEGIIQNEIELHPELDDRTRSYFLVRQTERTKRRRQEWALADVVIANSTFTRDSYAAAGLDVGKVRIVALGSPPIYEAGVAGGSAACRPLRALFAGTLSIHKGGHYLVDAWRSLAPGQRATLEVYGAVTLPKNLISNLPASINVSPTIPRAELFKRYCTADVLVFPTLCDGFGMVVTEAFAHGLPVITTKRAGASALVRHGENGLIVPAGDPSALADALKWCLTHRNELKAMRKAAIETAARWQWRDFRQALAANVIKGVRDAGYIV